MCHIDISNIWGTGISVLLSRNANKVKINRLSYNEIEIPSDSSYICVAFAIFVFTWCAWYSVFIWNGGGQWTVSVLMYKATGIVLVATKWFMGFHGSNAFTRFVVSLTTPILFSANYNYCANWYNGTRIYHTSCGTNYWE